MPSASANMSAKFIAQIEMSASWVPRKSTPALATSPVMVSISGRPAATSDPNASTRMASVTGQLKSSERIIAVRFAVLKSDHIAEAPVAFTRDAVAAGRVERSLEAVGRAHHLGRIARRAAHHDRGVAVRRERDAGPRRHDRGDRRVGAQDPLRPRDGGGESGSGARSRAECTTTMSAPEL